MAFSSKDPIIAVATASGRAGIGVVRLSGADLSGLALQLSGRSLAPRHATLVDFLDQDGAAIDRGIAIYFKRPNSYTGEDVLELQAHGGPIVLQMLVARALELGRAEGLRLAEPGEFTERAFLNDKLDLAQAEAVADLIEASTESAARSARASLDGTFSRVINLLVEDLIGLRLLIEATLDFPEEEIDFLNSSNAHPRLVKIAADLDQVLDRARQGALLRSGMTVVLAGRPNVGKSSLLNALAENDVAIVTNIPGTTRDRVTQTIEIEGIALHIIDTAGLRTTDDPVEAIGIERSWQEIRKADVILNLRDANDVDTDDDRAIAEQLPDGVPLRVVLNKADLADEEARIERDRIYLSALTGAGIDLLRSELLDIAGWHATNETVFFARERHLEALRSAREHLARARGHADQGDRSLDLLAEELRFSQEQLSLITGAFTADDLLGEIFGRFCIGK
jgi:tRNA modification GTPase